MILTVRTDNPEAELGLFENGTKKAYIKWHADRNLSVDIHKKIKQLFNKRQINFYDLKGVVFYKGPGSFTGLRIGASVAGTIAYDGDVPIAGAGGEDWIAEGLELLKAEPAKRSVELEYGAPPKITKPKK